MTPPIEDFAPSVLPTDSKDMAYLYSAAKNLNVDAPTVEIGLRYGGSTEAIACGLKAGTHSVRTHIAVDPYGDIGYVSWGKSGHYNYTNKMRDDAVPVIRRVCSYHGVNFVYLPLEDTEFFARFSDGVPVYDHKAKAISRDYSLVHFDGPHGTNEVLREVEFFAPRSPLGCHWIFDDTEQYDHGTVEAELSRLGFIPYASNHKRWYVRETARDLNGIRCAA